MSLYDLLQRTDSILKKYEKFDSARADKPDKASNDFDENYKEVEQQIEELLSLANDIHNEKNRALAASKNAEIRKLKSSLLNENVPALRVLAKKRKRGVKKEVVAEREERVNMLIDKVYAIPDGMSMSLSRRPYRYNGKDGSKKAPVHLDSSKSQHIDDDHYKHSDETSKFAQEWEASKRRQDEQLDRINEGVSALHTMAAGMQEEMDRHDPVLGEVDRQMDKLTQELKTNNMKMLSIVNKMRSSRNFCIDAVLICIVLGIGAYLFSMFS